MQIVGEIPFILPQSDTWTTDKQSTIFQARNKL